jgi:hypothetical protein
VSPQTGTCAPWPLRRRGAPAPAARPLPTLLAALVAALVGLVVLALGTSACRPCRSVEFRALPLTCAPTTPAQELHFDREAPFRTFLTDVCGPGAQPEQIDAIVEQVDFGTEAVFVAIGARLAGQRCVRERAAEEVSACDNGLRVVFADSVDSDPQVCGGIWTVAVVLHRDDLRAALVSASREATGDTIDDRDLAP